jgi:hypothetical protein
MASDMVVLLDVGISGHELWTLDRGLGDQHAIERVAVMDGKPACCDRVRTGHW